MIFYFSATGNSLYVAQRVASALEDTTVPVMDALKDGGCYDVGDGELVGIVAPVYFYGLPMFIEEFVQKMRFTGKPSFYLILTYGTYTATTAKKAEKEFAKAGFSLDYVFSINMPENYILLMKVPEQNEKKKLLDEADAKIDCIITSLRSGDKGDHDDGKGPVPWLVTGFSRPFYIHGRSTSRFYTTGMCTGCGKCTSICPIGAIEMIDRIPTWTQKKCLRCLACVHRCPSRAIEFGSVTKKKERYVNPNVRFPD